MRLRPAFKKPSFLWQGLMIVLPAIVMAAIGFVSLRQDRVLARHEATEQAKTIAAELARRHLPAALKSETVSFSALAAFRSAPSRPEEDPVFALGQKTEARIACLVHGGGELLYPPPIAPLPEPQTLDIALLSEAQQADWGKIQNAASPNQDVRDSLNAFQRFLATEAPAPFTAMAYYALAVAFAKRGLASQAEAFFELVRRDFPEMRSEAGLSLRTYSELQLIELMPQVAAPPERRAQLLYETCARAVLEPSEFSGFILNKAGELESRLDAKGAKAHAGGWPSERRSIAERWRNVWNAHQTARRIFGRLLESTTLIEAGGGWPAEAFWFDLSERRMGLGLVQPVEHSFWLTVLGESKVQRLVHQVSESLSLPNYLGLEVDIAAKKILPVDAGAELLAVSMGFVLSDAVSSGAGARGFLDLGSLASRPDSDSAAPLRVSVYLTDPAALYAHQRRRTLWFGALIAVSALALLIGFVAAWRAFHRQQQLSELKSNFVSSVSHELRAPIASVRLMAEELEDLGPQDRRKNKEYHHFIVQECRRLSALIENVLDFSRHDQGRKEYEFEPTDMAVLVEETVKLMRAYGADQHIEVTTTVRGEPVELEVDGRAIQQVLVNLIDNAIKHSPQNSSIKVGVEFQETRTLLWVEDQGEGIPPDEHTRIFERFYRRGSELRRETQGVGLGLAIVKYVTEAHGGKVSVRSAPGQGSRFTVELPLREQSPGRIEAPRGFPT